MQPVSFNLIFTSFQKIQKGVSRPIMRIGTIKTPLPYAYYNFNYEK